MRVQVRFRTDRVRRYKCSKASICFAILKDFLAENYDALRASWAEICKYTLITTN